MTRLHDVAASYLVTPSLFRNELSHAQHSDRLMLYFEIKSVLLVLPVAFAIIRWLLLFYRSELAKSRRRGLPDPRLWLVPKCYERNTQENLSGLRSSVSMGMAKPHSGRLSPTACLSLWNAIVSSRGSKKTGCIPEDSSISRQDRSCLRSSPRWHKRSPARLWFE